MPKMPVLMVRSTKKVDDIRPILVGLNAGKVGHAHIDRRHKKLQGEGDDFNKVVGVTTDRTIFLADHSVRDAAYNAGMTHPGHSSGIVVEEYNPTFKNIDYWRNKNLGLVIPLPDKLQDWDLVPQMLQQVRNIFEDMVTFGLLQHGSYHLSITLNVDNKPSAVVANFREATDPVRILYGRAVIRDTQWFNSTAEETLIMNCKSTVPGEFSFRPKTYLNNRGPHQSHQNRQHVDSGNQDRQSPRAHQEQNNRRGGFDNRGARGGFDNRGARGGRGRGGYNGNNDRRRDDQSNNDRHRDDQSPAAAAASSPSFSQVVSNSAPVQTPVVSIPTPNQK